MCYHITRTEPKLVYEEQWMAANDQFDGATNLGSALTTTPRDRIAEPATEEEIRAAHVGEVTPLNGPVLLAEFKVRR
jgi:hypothetical protein